MTERKTYDDLRAEYQERVVRACLGAPRPSQTVWKEQANGPRNAGGAQSVSGGMCGDGAAVGPGRYLGPRYGHVVRVLPRDEYPVSGQIDDELGGDDPVVSRSGRGRGNPRHDFTAWSNNQLLAAREIEPADLYRELFGPEHFAQRVAPKPEPRGKTYGIGELSRRMGRSTSQMRTWIRRGWLPDSTHATGTGMAMRRRWTLSEIGAIVMIASEEGLLKHDNRSVSATNFKVRCADALARLDDAEKAADNGD